MSALRALLVALLLWLAPATPALAHADQVSMTPTANSMLTQAPTQVVLGFSEKINPLGTVVVVIDPTGAQVQDGTAVVKGQRVIAKVKPFEVAGKYRVNYRIVSADGHAISGTRSFAYAPGGAVPTVAPSTTDDAAATANRVSWGMSPAIVLSLVMMLIIAAVIAGGLYAARRRGHL